jgi:hypothetical protein
MKYEHEFKVWWDAQKFWRSAPYMHDAMMSLLDERDELSDRMWSLLRDQCKRDDEELQDSESRMAALRLAANRAAGLLSAYAETLRKGVPDEVVQELLIRADALKASADASL